MVGACFGREDRSLGDAVPIANEVLAFTGLKSRSSQLASSLNVAQKKRLELARALAARPYLLLLDEVLAGLNPSEVETMVQTIHSVRDQGITIIMIEHVMRAIMNVSDRIMVLDYGQKIADGTPQEVANDERVIEAYLGDPRVAQQFSEEGGS
jgi:branched-chain amino acid transport system ATP-binding protein